MPVRNDFVDEAAFETALRDYFAAKVAPEVYRSVRDDMRPVVTQIVKAMRDAGESVEGFLECPEMKEIEATCLRRCAEQSYAIADALLAARKQGGKEE